MKLTKSAMEDLVGIGQHYIIINLDHDESIMVIKWDDVNEFLMPISLQFSALSSL
jgi:hypothetical protein